MLALLPIIPIIISLLVLFVPGITLVPLPKRLSAAPMFGARVILWSVTILIISSFVLTALGLPPFLSIILALIFSVTVCFKRRASYTKQQATTLVIFISVFLLVYLAFSIPFLLIHDGLPTGDSQKSIYWANYIINNQELPNYSLSINKLNRDPVDFYTPGLHSFTAAVMQAIPTVSELPLPLTTVGLLSISLAISVSIIATAIGLLVINKRSRSPLIILVPFFILTNYRFLRYLREPGYHYQNIVGELLLFGLLFLVISLLAKKRTSDIILSLCIIIALSLTHQFSAFLAVFALTPALLLFFLKYKKQIYLYFSSHRFARFAFVVSLLFVAAISLSLNLQSKIPHIFTNNPHLISSTPNILDYPKTMGTIWFLLGFVGVLWFISRQFLKKPCLLQQAFLITTIALLALSQGPRIFVDIPPIRALLYSVVPLSITATYIIIILWKKISIITKPPLRILLSLLLVTIIVTPSYLSTAKAYILSHQTRTNSSLLSEHFSVIFYLKNFSSSPSKAILIDDYNRRSSSWILLSDQPTYSRLSSNIKRAMDEMSQSSIRRQIYLKHLDFEKIFSLGSFPEITQLLAKHNIEHIAGVDKSSYTAFSHNPALHEATRGGDLTVFKRSSPLIDNEPHDQFYALPKTTSSWLLKSSTLANDIGDPEDTYKHLPASLLATRLSAPKANRNITYRTTSAPFIPISFNVNSYVSALWDQDNSGHPDSSLQLVIKTINSASFSIKISDSFTTIISGDGTPVTIPSAHVNLDQDDLVTFIILNPTQQQIDFDLIALGLAQIP